MDAITYPCHNLSWTIFSKWSHFVNLHLHNDIHVRFLLNQQTSDQWNTDIYYRIVRRSRKIHFACSLFGNVSAVTATINVVYIHASRCIYIYIYIFRRRALKHQDFAFSPWLVHIIQPCHTPHVRVVFVKITSGYSKYSFKTLWKSDIMGIWWNVIV